MRLGEVEELVQGPLLVSGLSWSGNRDVAETLRSGARAVDTLQAVLWCY